MLKLIFQKLKAKVPYFEGLDSLYPSGAYGFPKVPQNWRGSFLVTDSSDYKEKIFVRVYEKNQQDKQRTLFIVHGQGEHSGRYLHFISHLQDIYDRIVLFDHRGHGLSSGIRGDVEYFDLYCYDLARLLEQQHKLLQLNNKTGKIDLFAHSMGGLIALRALELIPSLPVELVLLSAPMTKLAFEIPKLKLLAGKVLMKVTPSCPLPSKNPDNKITRNKSVRLDRRTDPLNHDLASPRFYFSYLESLKNLSRDKDLLDSKKIALFLPLSDHIIEPSTTKQFFLALKGKQKTLFEYKEFYHEVFNEPERDVAFNDLKQWILANK